MEMNSTKNLIDSVIYSIDWRKIKSFHVKLGIKWTFEFDKQQSERIPTVSELRDDLSKILEHMYERKLQYISYGNWVIFWENHSDNSNGDIRVIFRLADFLFESTEPESKESLESALAKAIESEDYEHAAKIRDVINKEK